MYPKIFARGNTLLLEYDGVTLLIDPSRAAEVRPDIILITHAHTDHVSALASTYRPGIPIVMSEATYRILRLAGYSFRDSDLNLVAPGDVVEFRGLRIRARNAGHIVGSLMYEIDFGKMKVGVTGDFNFEDSLILPRADIMDVDVLVVDATYGKPIFAFPPRTVLYSLITERLRELLDEGYRVSLHGFALGKGQELTKLVGDYLGVKVSVDKDVGMYNKIYEVTYSKLLGIYEIGGDGPVFVRGLHRKVQERDVIRVVFTGWVAMASRRRIGFPLSSHNSFVRLVDYIIRAQPDLVYVAYGYKQEFADFLIKEMGVPSKPVPEAPEEVRLRMRVVGRRRNYTVDAF